MITFQNVPVNARYRPTGASYTIQNNSSPHHNITNGGRRKVLCLRARGRLGNKMFQFSAGYSLSKFYNRRFVFFRPNSFELRRLFAMRFTGSSSLPYSEGKCGDMKEYVGRGFQQQFFEIKDNNSFQVHNYFEHPKYFAKDIHEILQLFTLTDKYLKIANHTIRRHCPLNTTSIGVHVRRGDILHAYSYAPWSYFQQAMDFYRSKYTKVHFFVASDDRKWCQSNFKNTPDVTFLSGDRFEDMAVLSECEHSIISVGTFSWWSGMLAKGTVVYYESSTRRRLHKDEPGFYPQDWVPMPGYNETLP